MQSMVLRTLLFAERHTEDNIAKELKNIRAQFGLDSKTVIYITDQGSNMVKSCKIAGSERFGCVAHGLRNLIVVEESQRVQMFRPLSARLRILLKPSHLKVLC